MQLRDAIAPFAALILAGCGAEAPQTGPIDSRVLRSVASVHVDVCDTPSQVKTCGTLFGAPSA